MQVIEAQRTSILEPRDHLHIKHDRSMSRYPQRIVARQIGMICVPQPMSAMRPAGAERFWRYAVGGWNDGR